jgi:hypothetical protein
MFWKKQKKYIIEKQDTSTSNETTQTETDDYTETETGDYTETETGDYTETETGVETTERDNCTETDDGTETERDNCKFRSICDVKYKKPENGTKQENLTRDDVIKQLDKYIPLKTIKDKRYLEHLPLFKCWIKYFSLKTRQFRLGGLLIKVCYPDYIMLLNPTHKITWSVQLNDNIIYMPDPRLIDLNKSEKDPEKSKERFIKNKLFDMYKRGKLTVKK